jgi:4'-phosphopantetheinyl transferase EntD
VSDSLYGGIEARLSAAFGPGVEVGASSILLQADAYADALFPEEAATVAKAVAKRRNELAAGRILARRNLERLGHPPAPLVSRPDRTVRWPAGIVGSISHTGGLCVAVVARQSDALAIGVDVEEATPLSENLWKVIAHPAEKAAIDGVTPDPEARALLGKLLFSAKECLYKCQYPLSETLFDFLDATVRFVDLEALDQQPRGRFEATILHSAAIARHPRLARPLAGFYAQIDRWLICGMRLDAQ